MDGEGCWDFPSDAFAEILLRLPATSRRRFRLVCRHWRDVIDERAPARPSEPKPLAYVIRDRGWGCATGSAYVIDDLAAEGRCRKVWRGRPLPAGGRCFDTRMVGTCNDLLCLCDNTRPGGAVSLVNPATGESLAIPPLPGRARIRGVGVVTRWHQTYGFVHHPTTGRYTVVHLPCYSDRTEQLDTVRAFTLGEAAAWRDVAAPAGTSCRLDAGLVAVGGTAYWVTKGSERVMSFDAEDERVAPVAVLPVAVADGDSCCHLTEVCGRLGFVVTVDEPKLARVEVWVLEGVRDERAWSCRYRVQVHGAPKASRQELALPHFVFARAGECVLTNGPDPKDRHVREDRESVVFAHLAGAGRLQCGEVRINNERKPGTAVARAHNAHIRTFNYVETTEPLCVYKIDRRVKGSHRQNKSCSRYMLSP